MNEKKCKNCPPEKQHRRLECMLLFSSLFSSISFLVGSQGSFNYTNLMEHHFTLCGPRYFCNLSKFYFAFNISEDLYALPLCPDCYCDERCYLRQDCCPDKFFAYPVPVCVNVTVVIASLHDGLTQESHYLLFNSCPQTSDISAVRECNNTFQISKKLEYPPVTNLHTGITYINKFCAECNKDRDIITWYTEIKCDKNSFFTDFNFLSSYNDVITHATLKHCIIQAYHPFGTNCFVSDEKYFSKCNKTGTWGLNYDSDVEYGCKTHFFQKDMFFKNMFCKMCNPSFTAVKTADICNMTGFWHPYDKSLEDACRTFPQNFGRLPFKNVFCYLCNRNNFKASLFQDALAKLDKDMLQLRNGTKFFYTHININGFNSDAFFQRENRAFSAYKNNVLCTNETEDAIIDKRQNINISSLILQKIALTEEVSVCDESYLRNITKNSYACSCDPIICLTTWKRCCDDISLTLPTVCLNSRRLSKKSWRNDIVADHYKVLNDCYFQNRYPHYSYKRCTQQNNRDLFSFHPVSNNNTGVSYSNMYCFLCNEASWPYSLDEVTYKPWDIDSNCSKFIDHENFLLLRDLIITIEAAECYVKYYPPEEEKTSRCWHFKMYNVDKCNTTGLWSEKDTHVEWACENLSESAFEPWSDITTSVLWYKNVFCALCNPVATGEMTNDSCIQNFCIKNFQIECEFFPKIDFYYPYKNVFCRKCNNGPTPRQGALDINTERLPGLLHLDLPDGFLRGPRELFSVNDVWHKQAHHTNGNCSNNQIYDVHTDSCRNMTCYPRKYLVNDTCQPLFTMTKNLAYSVSTDFTGLFSHTISIKELEAAIKGGLNFYLNETLSMSRFSLVEHHLHFNQYCFQQNRFLGLTSISGQINLKLFTSKYVVRLDVEEKLLNFSNSHLLLFIRDHFMLAIPNQPETTAYADDICSWKIHTSQSSPLRTIVVSKLMTCKQVELFPVEFEVTDNESKLYLLKYNVLLEKPNFDLMHDGSARVCVEDISFNDSKIKQQEDIPDSLQIVSFICAILSIVFLAIMLIIHFYYFELHSSLPGKNITILISSLLVTQSTFQLSDLSKSFTTCAGFGIVLHYLWLVSFFSMSICSFHMYRVFTGHTYHIDVINQHKLFKKYLFYVLFTPVVIVCLNMVMTKMLSSNGSIGYGIKSCFISNKISLMISFLIPVAIICISNVFFFVSVILAIKRTPKVSENKNQRNDFSIFIRLFTVTGITWLFQILDSLLPVSIFSYLSTVINNLQGFFVFVAFVCNRKVIGILQNKNHSIGAKKYSKSPKAPSVQLGFTSNTSL